MSPAHADFDAEGRDSALRRLSQGKRSMTQAQTDYEVVKGWRDCALAAREETMVAFYERLLAALKRAGA